jgi:hypothetical protein
MKVIPEMYGTHLISNDVISNKSVTVDSRLDGYRYLLSSPPHMWLVKNRRFITYKQNTTKKEHNKIDVWFY